MLVIFWIWGGPGGVQIHQSNWSWFPSIPGSTVWMGREFEATLSFPWVPDTLGLLDYLTAVWCLFFSFTVGNPRDPDWWQTKCGLHSWFAVPPAQNFVLCPSGICLHIMCSGVGHVTHLGVLPSMTLCFLREVKNNWLSFLNHPTIPTPDCTIRHTVETVIQEAEVDILLFLNITTTISLWLLRRLWHEL